MPQNRRSHQRAQMRMRALGFSLFVCIASALSAHAFAQEPLKEKGPARTVKMFNVFCLSQLPELDAVAKAAGFGEFTQITGPELERYRPKFPAEELRAWRFRESGSKFVLTTVRTKPDATFKKEVPEFARSTSFTGSLRFPARDPKVAVLKELVTLLGRNADAARQQEGMRVHSWTRQMDKVLSRVHYYAAVESGPPSVLSASVFVKD